MQSFSIELDIMIEILTDFRFFEIASLFETLERWLCVPYRTSIAWSDELETSNLDTIYHMQTVCSLPGQIGNKLAF